MGYPISLQEWNHPIRHQFTHQSDLLDREIYRNEMSVEESKSQIVLDQAATVIYIVQVETS